MTLRLIPHPIVHFPSTLLRLTVAFCLSLCFMPYFAVRIINTSSSEGVLKYFSFFASGITPEYLLSRPGLLYLNLCGAVKVKLISDRAEEPDSGSSSPISFASEETRVIAGNHILGRTVSDCWLCEDRSRSGKAKSHFHSDFVLCWECNKARRRLS